MVTTLHGAASQLKNHLYYEYLKNENFVSLSFAERTYNPNLNYVGNVYNGIDFSKYTVTDGSGGYVVFSGRISEEKGIKDAIDFSEKSGIPLKIAGIIQDKEYYNSIVKPHLSQKIEYLGNLDYADYTQLLKRALALLFFIHYNDACPLSVLDALASGIPVIANNKGSLPELIYDEKMGAIVNSLDEAIDVVKNKQFNYMEIQNLARAKFDRTVMASQYLEIYKQLT
jgi:glycosyltransferase involved in cell wall biosynthesis